MHPLLVADVGGTNVRFAICVDWQNCPSTLTHQRTFRCTEFRDFAVALEFYRNTLPQALPKHACIAIAGPIFGDLLKLTNLDWHFSASSIRKQFGLNGLEIINDFEAQAHATTLLTPEQIHVIRPGISARKAPRAVIGPGTGLGIASLYWTEQGWRACPGEGGHMSFAPTSEQELQLFTLLRKQFEHISLEHLLSGPGLITIYQCLAELEKKSVECLSTKEIIQSAQESTNNLCYSTINLFINILALTAGDIALIFGAKGGVYFGGGLIEHLAPFIDNAQFTQRFISTGTRAQYLHSIPVYIMLHPNPGLVGAALAYQRKQSVTELSFVD